MRKRTANLHATLKTVDEFGTKYAADFPPTSTGGKQFALVGAAVAKLNTLGAGQVSGTEDAHASVLSLAVAYTHLHDDMAAISKAAHTLALLGTPNLEGKFILPHGNNQSHMLNWARAFLASATPLKAEFLSVEMPADFLEHLSADIAAFEDAAGGKRTGTFGHAGATRGIDATAREASVALHVLDTIVRNVYRNNPQRLGEWTVASHVQKHTPIPFEAPAPTPPPPAA